MWIVGPCAAESEFQVKETAAQLAQVSAAAGHRLNWFRAGVWKPRSNPSSFCGAGEPALAWLSEVQRQYGWPVCVEVMTPEHVALCHRYDIHTVWVGARTAVNPTQVQLLADAVRKGNFTVLVKNPLVPDLNLWMGNIERFQQAGAHEVIAVHRGCPDANENVYRNAPCWDIPVKLRVKMPHLKIVCDPSHLCGSTKWIPQISQIALNYGFNGLMVECHHNPKQALSDEQQQLTPQEWGTLAAHLQVRTNAPNHDLFCQRTLLENIDTQISQLLLKRMEVVDVIADIKKNNNLPVIQPQQWQLVVERYLKPDQDEAYKQFVRQFLDLLHQASIERQK